MPRKGKFGTVDITVLGDELKVGDKAPDFKADKMDLTEYNLDVYKRQLLVFSSFDIFSSCLSKSDLAFCIYVNLRNA